MALDSAGSGAGFFAWDFAGGFAAGLGGTLAAGFGAVLVEALVGNLAAGFVGAFFPGFAGPLFPVGGRGFGFGAGAGRRAGFALDAIPRGPRFGPHQPPLFRGMSEELPGRSRDVPGREDNPPDPAREVARPGPLGPPESMDRADIAWLGSAVLLLIFLALEPLGTFPIF